MQLQRPFFPTYNSEDSLRHFHRPLLKRVKHGKLAVPGPHPVSGLLKHIKKKAKVKLKYTFEINCSCICDPPPPNTFASVMSSYLVVYL